MIESVGLDFVDQNQYDGPKVMQRIHSDHWRERLERIMQQKHGLEPKSALSAEQPISGTCSSKGGGFLTGQEVK